MSNRLRSTIGVIALASALSLTLRATQAAVNAQPKVAAAAVFDDRYPGRRMVFAGGDHLWRSSGSSHALKAR
jgi:hypothetical protein